MVVSLATLQESLTIGGGPDTRLEPHSTVKGITVSTRPRFEVDAGMLRGGVVLFCIGGVACMVGAALTATVLGKAASKWVSQLEESPSEMAQRRYHQFMAAAAAGSKAWREEEEH